MLLSKYHKLCFLYILVFTWIAIGCEGGDSFDDLGYQSEVVDAADYTRCSESIFTESFAAQLEKKITTSTSNFTVMADFTQSLSGFLGEVNIVNSYANLAVEPIYGKTTVKQGLDRSFGGKTLYTAKDNEIEEIDYVGDEKIDCHLVIVSRQNSKYEDGSQVVVEFDPAIPMLPFPTGDKAVIDAFVGSGWSQAVTAKVIYSKGAQDIATGLEVNGKVVISSIADTDGRYKFAFEFSPADIDDFGWLQTLDYSRNSGQLTSATLGLSIPVGGEIASMELSLQAQ